MDSPVARVVVEIKALHGLPQATLQAGQTRYVQAVVKGGSVPELTNGRSRPLPDAGGDFDLTTEAVPWVFEFDVAAACIIGITVNLLEDHGDAPAPLSVSVAGSIGDPWASGVQLISGPFQVECSVTTTPITGVLGSAVAVARSTTAAGASATLAVPQWLAVSIDDILGLYKPNLLASSPDPGSVHVAGYRSEDNLGRIFTNRIPDGSWKRETQYIELQVSVKAMGAGALIPAGATIKWTVLNPDDPTNDQAGFHREWGPYIDPNDYDVSGTPTGARGDGNVAAYSAGNTVESLIFGPSAGASPTARWAAATGGPSVSPASKTEASTPVTGAGTDAGTSSIRIHCYNVLGTSLAVRAELVGAPAGLPVFNSSTGVMTMWSLINVEATKMGGAFSLAATFPVISEAFLPICVQMDFQQERQLMGPFPEEMGQDAGLVDDVAAGMSTDPAYFNNLSKPGWFWLLAAQAPYPFARFPNGGRPPPMMSDADFTLGFTKDQCWIEVTAMVYTLAPAFVVFKWTDPVAGPITVGYFVSETDSAVTPTKMRITLRANDLTPGFTGHDSDGSLTHAMYTATNYFPRTQWLRRDGVATSIPGGFGVPTTGATVDVYPDGYGVLSGISPPASVQGKQGKYFAGRTILFTHHSKFSDGNPLAPVSDFNQKAIGTIVHEFLHAFGMPHKCGNWDWRSPRLASCCMNYFNTWLLDASGKMVPNTENKQSKDMCGRHIMEVRRVHLEKNLGLNW